MRGFQTEIFWHSYIRSVDMYWAGGNAYFKMFSFSLLSTIWYYLCFFFLGFVVLVGNAVLWSECSHAPQNSHIEILMPNVVESGDVSLEELGLWEWGSHESDKCFIKEVPQTSLAPSIMWRHNQKPVSLKKTLTTPYRHPILRHLVSKLWEINFYFS